VPFSQTEVGSGSVITPNYVSETFTVVTGGTYQVNWILSVTAFSTGSFSVGLRINGIVDPLTIVTRSAIGEVREEATLELDSGDTVQLINATNVSGFAPVAPSGGVSITLAAAPAIGASISFQRID
jgi:hypothetical protein